MTFLLIGGCIRHPSLCATGAGSNLQDDNMLAVRVASALARTLPRRPGIVSNTDVLLVRSVSSMLRISEYKKL